MLCQLGVVLTNDGDYVRADAVLHRALEIQEKALGPDDPDLGRTLRDLGSLLERRGDLTRAEEMDLRALAILEKAEGRARLQAGTVLNNLGVIYLGRRDYTRAGEYLERALPLMEAAYGATASTSRFPFRTWASSRAKRRTTPRPRRITCGPWRRGRRTWVRNIRTSRRPHQPRERLPLAGRPIRSRSRPTFGPCACSNGPADRARRSRSCRSSTWRARTPSSAIWSNAVSVSDPSRAGDRNGHRVEPVDRLRAAARRLPRRPSPSAPSARCRSTCR